MLPGMIWKTVVVVLCFSFCHDSTARVVEDRVIAKALLPQLSQNGNFALPCASGESSGIKGNYPWQVSIQRCNKHLCSGIIINNQWVVAPASCWDASDQTCEFRVIAGKVEGSEDAGIEQVFAVTQMIKHPYHISLYNGMGLIQICGQFKPSYWVDPIPMASLGWPEDSSQLNCLAVEVNSVESDEYDNDDHNVLEGCEASLVPRATCEEVWQEHIIERQICGKCSRIEKCLGKLGTSLVCKINESWTLVGIVNFINWPSPHPDKPSVFTNIGHYKEWIQETINSTVNARSQCAEQCERQCSRK